MTSPATYQPPTSTEMLQRQDERDALRFLVAQRRLYRKAKRWLGLRWFGMLVIGLAAPVVSVAEPALATAAGAIAGIWIFVGRTLLQFLQSKKAAAAAAVQEQFDFYVFGMPNTVPRSTLPTLEVISGEAGADASIAQTADREKLRGWYSMRAQDPGEVSVAISQRANAAYSDQLLRTTVTVWVIVSALWGLGLVGATLIFGLSLQKFLLGVLLPVLPAFLDVVEYILGIQKSARLRRDLVTTIEGRVRDSAPIEPEELVVWQSSLYDLRRATPQVPDFIYNLRREKNEQAMHSAAGQLGDQANGQGGP